MFLNGGHNNKHGHKNNTLLPQLCNEGCWDLAPLLLATVTQSHVGFTIKHHQLQQQCPCVQRRWLQRLIGWTTAVSSLHTTAITCWQLTNDWCEQEPLHTTGGPHLSKVGVSFHISQSECTNYWSSKNYIGGAK